MEKLYRLIAKASQSSHPVLILGETGTGKEMIARAIHYSGPWRDKPFIPVDCGSLVATLIESELFGHTKGAFTGASQAKEGLLATAEGGTVFLDEIGELAIDLQAKLLRALQEKEIRPVGSTKSVPVNVRILAATNHDLEALVACSVAKAAHAHLAGVGATPRLSLPVTFGDKDGRQSTVDSRLPKQGDVRHHDRHRHRRLANEPLVVPAEEQPVLNRAVLRAQHHHVVLARAGFAHQRRGEGIVGDIDQAGADLQGVEHRGDAVEGAVAGRQLVGAHRVHLGGVVGAHRLRAPIADHRHRQLGPGQLGVASGEFDRHPREHPAVVADQQTLIGRIGRPRLKAAAPAVAGPQVGEVGRDGAGHAVVDAGRRLGELVAVEEVVAVEVDRGSRR